MDADDVCLSTRLERQVAFLDANPAVGLVGCGVYDSVDDRGEVLATCYLPAENESIQRTLMERWCLLHSSIMFRRGLYKRVGGYRRAFEPVEDHDFILRIVEHCRAHNLGERLVSYRVNPGGLSVTGHRNTPEAREIAIRLARRRRSGRAEDLDIEVGCVLELKRRPKPVRGVPAIVQACHDSLYAATRYYELGCRELSDGHVERARRCFGRSVRTNGLLVKSWMGLCLCLLPKTAASRLQWVAAFRRRPDATHGGSTSNQQSNAVPLAVESTHGRQRGHSR